MDWASESAAAEISAEPSGAMKEQNAGCRKYWLGVTNGGELIAEVKFVSSCPYPTLQTHWAG